MTPDMSTQQIPPRWFASQERTIRHFTNCLRDGYTAKFDTLNDGRVKVTVYDRNNKVADIFAIDARGFTVAL